MDVSIYRTSDGSVTLSLKAKTKKDHASLALLDYQNVFCVSATEMINETVHDVVLHYNRSIQDRYERGKLAEKVEIV